MTKKNAQKIIRQRTQPSLFDFGFITTRAHLQGFIKFRASLENEARALSLVDIGCGYKPFQRLLKDVSLERYVGVDFNTQRSAADVVGRADALPFPDNSFDAVIASEVLEHTPNLVRAIDEIRRIARSGALVYVSTPFIFGEHGVPHDFRRITQYLYRQLFKDDEIVFLRGTNTSLALPFFINNVVLQNIAALSAVPLLPQLWYLLNNLLALAGELLVSVTKALSRVLFSRQREKVEKIVAMYFYTMPAGYDVIIRINK